MLDYSKVRFLWRGDAGRKVSSGRYEKIYDMGPRAATGDAAFATAATRPLVDELGPYYGLNVGQIQNALRNNTMQGAVVGTPGTIPTNWSEGLRGLTRQVVAIGVLNGIEYIDLRFSGTATSTGAVEIRPEAAFNVITASTGQAWTGSAWWQVLAQPSPANSYQQYISEHDSGGSELASSALTLVDPTLFTRKQQTRTLSNASTTRVFYRLLCNVTSGLSYDFTIRVGLPQLEQSAYAEPVVRTTGTAVASVGTVAQIVDAIPTTGTIIMWNNMVNAYPSGGFDIRIFSSEDVSTSFVELRKDVTNINRVHFRIHNNTESESLDLDWQPTNQYKRWFFAMTFDGTTGKLYRGDIQGNLSLVIQSNYTVGTQAIRDLFLGSNAAGATQTSQSFTDIMTYDAVMTAEQIQGIFYGTIPVFQQTAYAGTFVDKFRQKVQAEPASTYDTTLESTVLADWSEDIFGVYDADASAFFSRGFEDGATLENLDATNTFILALKAL